MPAIPTSVIQKIKKPFLTFCFFLIIGLISWHATTRLELNQLVGVLLFLIVLIAGGLRLLAIILKGKLKQIVFAIGVTVVVFFINLLVLSSGGIASPFLVVTHFFAIAASFLISPGVSISFILATILIIIPHTFIDPSSGGLTNTSPLITLLYFVAYIALLPVSFTLAREYKIKEEWVNKLEKQIATSKTQEDTLLKNIEDAVLVLNRKFEIMYLNEAVTKLFKYSNHALGKNFFSLFLIKDKEGRPVEKYNMPFDQILSSKTQSYIENIQIASENQDYTRVDLKILPVIEGDNALGLILVIKDITNKQIAEKKEKNVAIIALARFVAILNKQKRKFQELIKNPKKETVEELLRQNIELEHLSQDFFYSLRLESGEIGSLSSLVDISEILEEIILDEKWRSLEKGVKIVPKNSTNQLMPLRSDLKITIPKRRFEKVYILANPAWLRDSLGRLLEIIVLLTRQGQNVTVDVTRDNVLAQVTISSPIVIPAQDLSEIFNKFYGRLSNLKEFSQTSGLEGFIAKNLIDRLGGHITFETNPKVGLTSIKITFTLIDDSLEASKSGFGSTAQIAQSAH